MHAQITITGNVGTDVELRGGGTHEWTYAQFRLASTPRSFRNGSWHDGQTTWIGVTCKNKTLAENVKASISKGDPVIVTGKLTTSSYSRDDQTHERQIIEAVSVGHDLCRGTSAFRRVERAVAEPPSPGELDADLEQQQGEPAGEAVTVAA